MIDVMTRLRNGHSRNRGSVFGSLKQFLLQAWTDPAGSGRLRLTYFMTIGT
jgi:hypothetical protein